VEDYPKIRQAIFGGRVFPVKRYFKSLYFDSVMKGVIKYKDLIFDYILNLDTVSLYVTAMHHYRYPIGKHYTLTMDQLLEQQETLDLTGKLKMGIYHIKYVTNKKLLIPTLPRKDFKESSVFGQMDADSGLIWDLLDSEGWYTSVDIICAVKDGYKIRLLEGMCWDQSDYIFKEYMEMTFAMKKEAEENHNPVQRTNAKLMGNGLYGKMLQLPITKDHAFILNLVELDNFAIDHFMKDFIFTGTPSKQIMLVQGEKKTVAPSLNKPSHLGAFVLGYSRKIMRKHMKHLDPYRMEGDPTTVQWYGDTDSMHVLVDSPEYFETYIRPRMGKEMGMLANDFKENNGKIIEAIFLAPKSYCVTVLGNDDKISTIIKAKGLPKHLRDRQDFLDALQGKPIQPKPIQTIKRTGLSNFTSKNGDLELQAFTIFNQENKRSLIIKQWGGREWIDNMSYPFGYVH
jgi:hypothetical protein